MIITCMKIPSLSAGHGLYRFVRRYPGMYWRGNMVCILWVHLTVMTLTDLLMHLNFSVRTDVSCMDIDINLI